jgi:hypothetical protein
LQSGQAPLLLRNSFVRALVTAGSWTMAMPGRWAFGRVADGLDAARPAHLLRYIAFGLYLTGFLPDLLAS